MPKIETVGAGSPGDAIRAIEPAKPAVPADCCADILRRLDKLDEIAQAFRSWQSKMVRFARNWPTSKAAQDGIRQGQQNLDNRVGKLPKPPTRLP